MALIKCPDCGKEVSTTATSCPQCGRPMAVTTIELTSKKWKKYKLFGWGLFIFGFVVLIAGAEGNTPLLGTFGVLMALAGIVFGIIGRFGAWWHNA